MYQDVKFSTIDGIVLHGKLYPAARRGPAVILTPGYNITVDAFPPGVPEEFQRAGITALVYDPRNTGRSGGFPRNDIDPVKQAEDYSDAFIYISKQPTVDPKAIVFWGISLSAGIALSNAAVDRRIAAVIAVAPIFKFVPVKPTDAQRLKSKLMKDRESQVNHGTPPYILPIMESLAEIPFNSHVNANQDHDDAERKQFDEGQRNRCINASNQELHDGKDFDPPLSHNPYGTTIQSYHRMFLFEPVPLAMVKQVNPTPVMFLTPEMDQISPTSQQIEVFESLQGPKQQMIAPGKEHVYILNGSDMPNLVRWQVDFIWQVVRGRFRNLSGGTIGEKSAVEITIETVNEDFVL